MNINLMAPINQLGYGVASLNILKALVAYSKVALFPIGQPQVTNQEDADAVRGAIENSKFFNADAPCVKIWHQHDMAQFVGHGMHIGFPIFELDQFSDLEKHHLTSVDHLFVCSQWAKDVCNNHFSMPVSVVPLGVDMNIFKPTPRKEKSQIIFFNCGKWEIRKGHDILIEAFKRVSQEFNNVELWMMCSNPFNSSEEESRWNHLYNHPKIKLIPRAETQSQVYNIMSHVDCGIFPSRAEGWNLELLEMMAVGRHVIATDYSAHTEFCNKDNCYLIPVNGTESAFDGKWFFGQGKWASIKEPEIDAIVSSMRTFVQNHNPCLPTFNEMNFAGVQTASKFSWENTAKHILDILE